MSLSNRDLSLINNFLLGGAGIGGGAAMVTSLANYLKTLSHRADMSENPPDDNTLTLTLPRKKQPQDPQALKMATLGGGLAITGGLLAAGGSYALVKKLYQNMKKKELQQELQQAQQGYLGALQDSAEKSAFQGGHGMGLGEALTSLPVAVPLLLALASGVVVNKTLNKNFPPVKPARPRDPKRIVFRTEPAPIEEGQQDSDDDTYKAAGVTEADAQELVGAILLGHPKRACAGDLEAFFGALQAGRARELLQNVEMGWDTWLDMTKGASFNLYESPGSQMAFSLAYRMPAFAPVVKLATAYEFYNEYPLHFQWAAALPQDMQEVLCKVAGVLGAALRYEAMEAFRSRIPAPKEYIKEAGELGEVGGLVAILHMLLNRRNEGGGGSPGMEAPHTSDYFDAHTGESTEKDGPEVTAAPHDAQAQTAAAKSKDVIDEALNAVKKQESTASA